MPARRLAVVVLAVLCALPALAQSELRLPPDQTVEATGPGGAIVNYDASASGFGDDENGRPLVKANCSPASGSQFALGTTIVTCSAGNPPQTGTFKVNVVDRKGPALSLPRDIRTKATSNDGAVVTFDASAIDLVDGSVSVACSPASGSMFAVGATKVSCSASDSRGNTSSDSFNVDVYRDAPPPPPPTETLPDITVHATSANGAIVTFNIASYGDDQDGRSRQADCTPASGSLFAVGTTNVSCTFRNALDQMTTGTFHVIVLEFVPTAGPTLTLPGDITVEATSPEGAVVSYSASAVDGNGNSIAVACAPASGSMFAIGTTSVACSATDGSGNTASGAFSVTVTDSAAPVIFRVTATPDVLTPPNHALVPVTINVEVADDGDSAPLVRVYDVTSNEPIIGPGSGNTNFDWRITGPLTVELRAERSGQGDSRIYTIWVEAIDSAGNRSTATTTVTVPKGNDNLQQPVTTPPPPGRRRVSGR